MKADITRDTFRKEKRYVRVRQQQGRVQLDADWNEQGDIEAHLRETGVRDVIGASGAPLDGGGFRIESSGASLTITPGRMWVDGILCELAAGPVVPFRFSGPATSETGAGIGQPVDAGSAAVDTDGVAAIERPPSPGPSTFSVNLSAADAIRLGLTTGDAVKLLFQSTSIQEFGPYSVIRMASPQSGGIDVTLSGLALSGMGSPLLRKETTYLQQPDFPGAADPPEGDGTYLVYLDVWALDRTWLDDPEIRETALAGPDTATREKHVCQVRLLKIGTVGEIEEGRPLHCLSRPALWEAATAPPTGRMRARAVPEQTTDDPCIVPDGAGFRGLENQLYRVEIYTKGDASTATFTWSRENASVVTRWVEVPATGQIRLADPGRDAVRGFHENDWVELIEDDDEADGRKRGVLVQLGAKEAEGIFAVASPSIAALVQAFQDARDHQTAPPRIKARRWDMTGPSGALPVKPSSGDGWITLENGVQVRFEAGTYEAGDSWLIPARTFTDAAKAGIEWPRSSQDGALPLPPHSVQHHYAKLAVVERTGGAGPSHWTVRGDCRELFPPLTGLIHLVKLCGDGQEALPGQELQEPLRLAVLNGGRRMPGKGVHVEVKPGGGSLSGQDKNGTSLDLTSGSDGIVECVWTLGSQYGSQRAEAWLVDEAGQVAGPRLCFAARQIVPVLRALCGDGQNVLPGQQVPGELSVSVWLDDLHVQPAARVLFRVMDGEGLVQALPDGQAAPMVEAVTGADGVAHCRWVAGATNQVQRVEAFLFTQMFDLDGDGTRNLNDAEPLGASVCFTANLLPPVPPRFFVQKVSFAGTGGGDLLNDSVVAVSKLAEGLDILCTLPLAPEPFGGPPGFQTSFPGSVAPKPVLLVTLDLPLRVGAATGGTAVVAFQPLHVQAQVSASGLIISWRPDAPTRTWLQSLFVSPAGSAVNTARVSEIGTIDDVPALPAALRVRLTLEGNFVWTPDKDGQPAAYLAGEALGRPVPGAPPGGRVDLVHTPLPRTNPDIEFSQDLGATVEPVESPSPSASETALEAAAAAPAATERTGLVISGDPLILQPTAISGNRAIAGRFQMWFWITRGDKKVLTAALQGQTSIVGNVEDESGAALPGVTVELSGPGRPTRSQVTDANGQFRFQGLESGTYTLIVRALDGSAATQTQITVPPDLTTVDTSRQTVATGAVATTASPALQDIDGVGRTLSRRLMDNGVMDPAAVAVQEPARLAQMLQVSQGRAQAIIDSARQLAGPPGESPAGTEPAQG
jgi:predicted flap endonuclease-1-like 5' DNA nuclease